MTVNSLKNKPVWKRSAAFGIKKAKRRESVEVNFSPTYPSAETEENLEAMRKALLLDAKKRNNREAVKLKMEKTFAYRRHEVVRDAPMVDDFMARWPAFSDVRLISCCFFVVVFSSWIGFWKDCLVCTGKLLLCLIAHHVSVLHLPPWLSCSAFICDGDILPESSVLFQINAEFKRITTVPLQSKCLSQLDLQSDKAAPKERRTESLHKPLM